MKYNLIFIKFYALFGDLIQLFFQTFPLVQVTHLSIIDLLSLIVILISLSRMFS